MYTLSYRQDDATYLAYFAFPNGDTLLYHGKVDGDRWVMEMQPKANGMRFVEEGSNDGGPWTVGEDYTARG